MKRRESVSGPFSPADFKSQVVKCVLVTREFDLRGFGGKRSVKQHGREGAQINLCEWDSPPQPSSRGAMLIESLSQARARIWRKRDRENIRGNIRDFVEMRRYRRVESASLTTRTPSTLFTRDTGDAGAVKAADRARENRRLERGRGARIVGIWVRVRQRGEKEERERR